MAANETLRFEASAQGKPNAQAIVTVVSLAFHSVVWMVLFGGLYVFVPACKKMFMDFGVDLPGTTILVIQISDWVVEYSYLLPMVLVGLIAADGMLLVHLSRSNRLLERLWSGLMFALPFVLMMFGLATILVPWLKLVSELGGE